jgi:hypothetical protein
MINRTKAYRVALAQLADALAQQSSAAITELDQVSYDLTVFMSVGIRVVRPTHPAGRNRKAPRHKGVKLRPRGSTPALAALPGARKGDLNQSVSEKLATSLWITPCRKIIGQALVAPDVISK